MKIASWNVNSLRVRLPQVMTWFRESDIDVLAIQETKVEDASFPIEEITSAGFFCDYVGQKTYNGVTTISKIPPKESINFPKFCDFKSIAIALIVKSLLIKSPSKSVLITFLGFLDSLL